MSRWLIPVRIVEIGRQALVVADTKAEALAKFRARDWEETSEAEGYIVTKVGAVRKADDQEMPQE